MFETWPREGETLQISVSTSHNAAHVEFKVGWRTQHKDMLWAKTEPM